MHAANPHFLPGSLALCLCLMTMAASAAAQTKRSRPQPPPGKLVDVGGYRLHLYCTGTGGGPTVVLIAGAGDFSFDWALVQPRVSRFARVCSYDRAGLAWSDPGPVPRTMRQDVYELHTLLGAARVHGPYVLVGHSIGGLIARLYAERHRHEDIQQFEFNRKMFGPPKTVPPYDKLPARIQVTRLWFRSQPPRVAAGPDYWAEELQAMYTARAGNPERLGDLPVAIVLPESAGGEPPPGIAADEWKRVNEEKRRQKMGLTALSRNAKLIVAEKSGHHIQLDEPQAVTSAIRLVLNAAGRRRRLTGTHKRMSAASLK